MLFIKYALIAGAVGLLISAATVLALDAYKVARSLVPPPVRWRLAARLALLAWLPLLPALSIVVVPTGMAGVRVSRIIAERLSDKVQIMMVPTDGRFFFANDVLKGSPVGSSISLQSER